VVLFVVWIAGTATSTRAASVEPDKPYAKVHNWRISTARFGVGCIAVYPYESWTEISVGGEKWDGLSLIVTVERQKFTGSLDDESNVQFIELVLDDERFGGLSPYGYRGTPGIIVSADKKVLAKLTIAPTLKLTERGALKLMVPLRDTSEALKKLAECFKRTR
jgi:hypothetical protein